MKVQICFEPRETPRTYRAIQREMTVKEAEQIFKERYSDNTKYGRVWLRKFDLWHYRIIKTLKER